MDFLIAWIVPTAVGAVIGAFTNWLAIKMLFRPRTELRAFGLRVPFTPGILPRERRRLSVSMGATVSAELITEDAVRRRLSEPDIREALRKAIDERLGLMLEGDASALLGSALREALGSASGAAAEGAGAVGAGAVGGGAEVEGVLGEIARAAWSKTASSEPFRAALSAAARAALARVGELPLARVMPPEAARDLAGLLLSREGVERLRGRLSAATEALYETPDAGDARVADDARDAGVAMGDLFPPEAVDRLVRAAVEGLYAVSLPAVERFLGGAETRAALEAAALAILRRAIERMNPLQRIIVSAAQYERDLARAMPDTVRDLVDAAMDFLRAPAARAGVAAAAAEHFSRAAQAGLAASLRSLVPRRVAALAIDAAVDALAAGGPAAAEALARSIAAKPDAKVSGLLEAVGLPSEALAERAADAAARALRGPGADGLPAIESRIASEAALAFASAMSRALAGQRLGDALGIAAEARTRLSDSLADRALAMLVAESGRIVAGLDVGKMVAERIDELDMAEVERIILDVAGRELGWITVIGGVLGALIGLAQAALGLLRG